jgi:Family of unknown function (DUF6152)
MQRFSRFLVVIALPFTAMPLTAAAHHSVAYYGNEMVQVAGTLVKVEWRNPHVRWTIEATDDKGSTQTWRMEGNSIYNLQRSGVTRDMFKLGDEVNVVGRRGIRDAHMVLAMNMLLPDGKELLLWDTTERYVDQEHLIVNAAAENKGIFRVWSVPAANSAAAVAQLARQPFTQKAIAARASWNLADNFATRCEPEGMPRIMVNPHPFEFIDHGDQITLRTELYDISRTIHMDRDAPPENEPWSRLGYSVGKWENGDLVVKTTRINWPYFDTIGTPLSKDVTVLERFKLSEDQTRIDFDVTVADPSTFTEPAVLRGYWLALGETILRFDCQPN